MIKGLLFDLDGVLVDTAKYHYLAWKELAKELGFEFTEMDNERLKGVSRKQSLEILLEIGNISMDEKTRVACCEKKNRRYVEYISAMKEDEVLPGARELLTAAREKGYLTALGSASKNSMMILDRLGLTAYFDTIIDGTKVEKAKPNPEVFLKGAEALGLPYEDCLVFEDSKAGIEAAHLANMKAVGVGISENLPNADIIVKNLTEFQWEDIA